MQEKTTGDQQNLPLVVGVDLGGTHIRTAVLQGSKTTLAGKFTHW